jgi:protein ImuA
MRFISCHDGKLQTLETAGLKASPARAFATGLSNWDDLAPQRMLARGAVHELLFDAGDGPPKFVASLLARAACHPEGSCATRGISESNGACTPRSLGRSGSLGMTVLDGAESMPVIWSDPRGEVYPPALVALGFDLANVYLLRASSDEEASWAVAECLRCRGVGAVIAAPPASRKMSRIEARRLQLAAERGGSVGILLRQTGRGSDVYAAATRWKVAPAPGERTVQRWTIQLLHGHGGRVGETVILEWCRETNSVRTTEQLSHRPAAETPAPAGRRATA